MHFTAGSVISDANNTYKYNKINSFLAVTIPLLIGAVLNLVINAIFGPGIFGLIVNTIVNAGIMFMVYKMALDVIRGLGFRFGESLSPFRNVINFIGVVAVFTIFSTILNEVLYVIFDAEAVIEQAIVIAEDGMSVDVDFPFIFEKLVPMFAISMIVMFIVQIKFYITQYLVVDDVDFVEAFKESWIKTKGNIWKIILVNLYVIGISLVLGLVIGLLMFVFSASLGLMLLFLIGVIVLLYGYFIPYIYILQATLYQKIIGTVPQRSTEVVQEEIYNEFNDFNDF